MAATRANQVGGADYTSGSLREDLANFITLVSPEKTPHLSMISTNKASNPRHEWQIDTLVDPDLSNSQSGSFEFATANNVNDTPDRLSNYTQVFGKTVHVEGSLLRSNPAGAKNWFQYAINKRKVELRRDIEARHLNWSALAGANGASLGNVVSNSGSTREMGGLSTYAGIVNRLGTTGIAQVGVGAGASTAITSSAGSAVSILGNAANFGARSVTYTGTTAVSDVALTQAHLDSVFQVTSENGGTLDTMQIPTGLKTHVSNLLIAGNGGAAERRASEMASKLNLAVDTVMTEFGYTIDLVSNYIMQRFATDADSVVYAYNSSSIKRTVLQSYDMEQDGTARYGKGAIVFCEETMEVADPSNVAMIVGATRS